LRELLFSGEHFADEFRGVIKAGRKHKLRVSHVVMQYNEAATLSREISFGGRTFPVSVPATADLKWEFWRLGYEWDFVASSRAVVGMITEIKVNKVNATLAASGYGSSVTDVSAPIPAIGFTARAYPHRLFSVTTEFTGFKVPGFIGSRITVVHRLCPRNLRLMRSARANPIPRAALLHRIRRARSCTTLAFIGFLPLTHR